MRAVLLALSVPAICMAQAQPRMTLDSLHFDFGRIAPNAIVSHRFKVTNTGSAPLTISRMTAGCGCTTTLVGKETLAPGESTELEVAFNPAGNRGPVQKTVEVVSDDALEPNQTLTFQADVLPVVLPDPEVVRFEDLVRKDRRKASVKVVSGTGQPIHLSDVDLSKAPWLGVTTREVGQDLWVDYDLLASRLPAGKLSGTDTVTLHVLNPSPSALRLQVQWELRAPVIASPARVAWAEPAGRQLEAFLQLRSRDRKPFRVLAAHTSNPLLQVSGVSQGPAAVQTIQVRMLASATPGSYDEKAFLTLDTPGHPEFEIRVSAALR